MSERIFKHECRKAHMNNCVSLQMFGKVNILSAIDAGYRRSIIKHNELVDRNRHALNRIINCIKFCGFHESPLRGHDEVEGSANQSCKLELEELGNFGRTQTRTRKIKISELELEKSL